MIVMVELADLPGVGEKTAEKLKDAGFADMMRLATATPKELLKILLLKQLWKSMKEEKM